MGLPGTRSDHLLSWLQSEGARFRDTPPLIAALGTELRRLGIEVCRVTTGIPILHPQIYSASCVWEPGKETVERRFAHNPAAVQNSPMGPVFAGREVRKVLEGSAATAGEFPIYADLRASGVTDYLALPVPFSDGTHKGVTFATARPGGFSEREVAVLRTLVPVLALLLERQALHRTTRTLLDTYVGNLAGQRVLDGVIKRGMHETIRAVIWACDMRGFTELSERLGSEPLVAMLDDYFGAMVDAVVSEGGEVLKFIGDAMLAIFPVASQGRPAAERALAAAANVTAAIEVCNAGRAAADLPLIRFGLALHVGDVFYGNIGGESRLDFTVIGPAVNVATRIEGLCKTTGRAVLLSADFVALCGCVAETVGDFALKGVRGTQAIYAPAP